MRILFVAGDVNLIGGIEKYNRDLLVSLEKQGAQVNYVKREKGGFVAKLSFVFRFIGQYIKNRPEIVFCGHLNFSPVCLVLWKIFGTPYTLALYGIEPG